MSINMQGAWTVRVKSVETFEPPQRFIIAGANSGNGTYAGSAATPPVHVTGAHWSITIQMNQGAGFVDSPDQITFPTVSGGNYHFDIQSNFFQDDPDWDDLILTCSTPVTIEDYLIYGNVSYYSNGCIFNPCNFPYLVIDTPAALQAALRNPSLKVPIEKLYPDRLRFPPPPPPGPIPDPPPFSPLVIPLREQTALPTKVGQAFRVKSVPRETGSKKKAAAVAVIRFDRQMSSNGKLMKQVKIILKKRGKKTLKLAQNEVLEDKMTFEPLRHALVYFLNEVWFDFLHPSLLSFASEAVGGKPGETDQVGAAIVLLAGGADIHDDIIDQSTTKNGQLTVFGKFGKDIAILAGDVLLFKGLCLLHEAIRQFPDLKRKRILESIKQAFLGISCAEAKEASYRGKIDLPGKEYFEIIKTKVAVAQATTKIGAILGNGTSEEVEVLSEYGRIFGILSTIRDEYIDVFETEELKNRVEKECLPLPILLTFQDPEKKEAILELIKQPSTEGTTEKILDIVMDSLETHKLTEEAKNLVEKELLQIAKTRRCQTELRLLLKASIEDI